MKYTQWNKSNQVATRIKQLLKSSMNYDIGNVHIDHSGINRYIDGCGAKPDGDVWMPFVMFGTDVSFGDIAELASYVMMIHTPL